jgi:mRNA-degrading endonuclease RelE of RelBE toxin-antitoxin system
MEIIFQSTKMFEKDLRKLSAPDRELVIERINKYTHDLLSNRESFFSRASQPFHLKLLHGFDSSLYSMRINQRIRVIVAVDDDPLFDQLIITLFRIAKSPDELKKVFSSVAESLYQSQLIEINPTEVDNDPVRPQNI